MTAHGPPDRVSLDALLAHRDWVRALARRLVLDENDADDVEQETWRMAVERPPRHAGSLRAWLAAVVRNAARGSGRRRSRRLLHETATPARRDVPSPEDLVAAAEVQTRLARAVLELDEPYRSTVLYRFHEGLEASEIAARLGVPVETVRTRVKRGIERLRERMGAELGDDRDAWALLVLGVRESVEKVPQTVPTLSSAAALGGVAMAIGVKTVAAAVVLVAAGVAWWLVPRDGGTPDRDEQAVSTATAPAAPSRAAVAAKESRARAAPPDDANPATDVAAAPVANGPVVHGRVIDDETQTPVAGVTVSLVWENARQPGKEPSAVTGDDGTFRVPGAEEGHFGDLLLQAYGYAETIIGAPWIGAGTALAKFDAGDVRIYRGKRVTGRVFAADGRSGVPGARICLSRHGGSTSNMWFNQAKEMGRSGDDGTFVLERVPPSLLFPYTLFAVAPAGVGWTTLLAVAGRAEELGVEVTLRPAGAATVTVTDEGGVPQANASVYASPRFEPLGPPSSWEAGHDAWLPEESAFAAVFGAKTDAAGIARFALLPTGERASSYDFIAHGKATGWSKRVRIAVGDPAAVTIVIETPRRRAVVAGVRVVDPDGHPVAGATIAVVSGPRDAKATTDADGVAVVLRQEGEPTREAIGWFDVVKDGFAKQNIGIKLTPDDGSPLPTVTLVRPAPVDGRIVDQDGKPVAGCYVDLIRDGQWMPSLTTAADGKFSFPDATSGEWTLRHNAPQPYDEWSDGNSESAVHGGDRDLVVTLRRLPVGKARLVASIVDADTGAPLAAQEAMLIPAMHGAETIRNPDVAAEFGKVIVPRLRPGRSRLWVRVPGRVAAVADVVVAEGQTEVAVRVVVGKAGTLRGRVDLGDSGIAMPGMVVLGFPDDWTRPGWAQYRTETMIGAAKVAADGTFVFEGLTPGRYRAWIDVMGFMGEGVADVPAGGEGTAVVTFVRGGVVAFRLEAPSVSSRVRVEVAQGDGPWRCVVSSSGDRGKVASHDCTLRPGRYRWRATFPADPFESARTAAEPAEGEFTVLAGETAVVDVPVVAKR